MAAFESARRHRVVRLPLEERSYPLAAMIDEGVLVPSAAGAYDIRGYLRREGIDEARYAELRASGLGHHAASWRGWPASSGGPDPGRPVPPLRQSDTGDRQEHPGQREPHGDLDVLRVSEIEPGRSAARR